MATETDKSTSRTINATEFKAKCLHLMNEVAESGEEIVITKHGAPVAKLTPVREKRKAPRQKPTTPWFGRDKGKIQILGDIISPLDEEWEAETNPDRVLNP